MGTDNLELLQGLSSQQQSTVLERITQELEAEEAIILKRLEDEKQKLLNEISMPMQKILEPSVTELQNELATMRYENELRELEDEYFRTFCNEGFSNKSFITTFYN